MRKIDITNQVFGRLTVLSEAIGHSQKQRHWKCQCSCGKEVIVYGGHLKDGHTKSCGCLQIEVTSARGRTNTWCRLPKGEAASNDLYSNYKRHAKDKKREFSITKEEFRETTQENCHYCGKEPSNVYIKTNKARYTRTGQENYRMVYNGIDRVDSSRGYSKDNIVACCKVCNIAKHSMTEQEFYNWISRTYAHLKSTGKI